MTLVYFHGPSKKYTSSSNHNYYTLNAQPLKGVLLSFKNPGVTNYSTYILVLGGMAFFILAFGIEKIPQYKVFHGTLAFH